MQYILILEDNKKEEETYLLYCQYTGNEAEMEQLISVIEVADPEDLDGDVAIFSVSRTRIPEAAVDAHVNIKDFGGYIHMFQKCEGTFTCPEFSEDPYQKARELNDYFFHGKLREHFSETAKKLEEQRRSRTRIIH